ncbi:hypothetical protein Dimus_035061 [Dionaea muscipula]
MEGVGARLGRSSSRYGTTTVFSGPVRKWKKKWVHVAPSSATAASSSNSNHLHPSLANGSVNGTNGSHLLLFKWTPISQINNDNSESNNSEDKDLAKDDSFSFSGEPKRRKYKYIPLQQDLIILGINFAFAVLEEYKKETEENTEDDDDNEKLTEPTSKNGSRLGEKPDINDMPMEESQDDGEQNERQDLNVSTLDLSLGLSSHEEEHESDSRTN